MRRGAAWAMALALCTGGLAACGGDDDSANGTTSTTAPSTSGVEGDLTAAVDEFCAKTEEFQTLFEGASPDQAGGGDVGPADPSAQEETETRLSELSGEIAQTMIPLQSSVSQMLPGDAARFRACAAVFGGSMNMPPQ